MRVGIVVLASLYLLAVGVRTAAAQRFRGGTSSNNNNREGSSSSSGGGAVAGIVIGWYAAVT